MDTLASMFEQGFRELHRRNPRYKNTTLYLPSGEVETIKHLGYGTFSQVYLGTDGSVYYVAKERTDDGLVDQSKEYLSRYYDEGFQSMHLPEMEYLGIINDDPNVKLFRSKLYRMPLGLQPEWGINDNSLSRDPKMPWIHPSDPDEEYAYWEYDALFEDFIGKKHRKELERAKKELDLFIDWAYKNGATRVSRDTTTQNMGLDDDGTLILVDPLWIV